MWDQKQLPIGCPVVDTHTPSKRLKKKFYTEDHRFPKRKMSTASLIL